MGRGTLEEVRDGLGTFEEVRDGSWDPREVSGRVGESPGGFRRVGGPSKRSRTGRGTLGEVWYGLEDPRGGPVRVGGPSGRSEMGRCTLGVVWEE